MSINFNQIRLFLNLWVLPLGLFFLGCFAATSASRLEMPALFAPLALVLNWLTFGCFAMAAVFASWSAWRMWQAAQGIGELCHRCAMPTRYISPGRYSPHYRCMACGLNRRA